MEKKKKKNETTQAKVKLLTKQKKKTITIKKCVASKQIRQNQNKKTMQRLLFFVAKKKHIHTHKSPKRQAKQGKKNVTIYVRHHKKNTKLRQIQNSFRKNK